jgi:hypothetical protein
MNSSILGGERAAHVDLVTLAVENLKPRLDHPTDTLLRTKSRLSGYPGSDVETWTWPLPSRSSLLLSAH